MIIKIEYDKSKESDIQMFWERNNKDELTMEEKQVVNKFLSAIYKTGYDYKGNKKIEIEKKDGYIEIKIPDGFDLKIES